MFSKRIDRLDGSLIREILQLTQKPEMISFAGGLPAEDIMPQLDFSHAPEHIRQYGPTEGEPQLRELIAQQLCALGRACTPAQVLVTSGSQQGIDLVSKLLIDDGTPVLLEAPSYLAAIQSFRLFGAQFNELPLSSSGIDPDDLRARIVEQRPAFAYLIPNFQNPSGVCYASDRRAAIARVLDESGVLLVEDEPYRELAYEETDRTPICAALREAPWVYLGSFSKTTCPGIRVGYLVCSAELFPYFARLKQATDLHTNRLGQWWAAEFMSSAGYSKHIEHLRDYYRIRRDAMHAALLSHFHDLAEWDVPAGGLFFWLRLKHKCDTRLILADALAQNVAFMPGEPFFANRVCQSGMMRLNFSHATPENIHRGVHLLADIVKAHA